jgi:hypothetical protein
VVGDLPSPLLSSGLEDQLAATLRAEADACAVLLEWAQRTQRAILALDAEEVAYASHQQLKALTELHRIDLARKSILMSWANLHGMAFSTVTVMDIAGRVQPAVGAQLMHLARIVAQRLADLSAVNSSNRSLVKCELELQGAIWRQFIGAEKAGAAYGPGGTVQPGSEASYLVECRV